MTTQKITELTDEHKAAFGPHVEKHFQVGTRTVGMTEDERKSCAQAIGDLHQKFDLPRPKVLYTDNPITARYIAATAGYISLAELDPSKLDFRQRSDKDFTEVLDACKYIFNPEAEASPGYGVITSKPFEMCEQDYHLPALFPWMKAFDTAARVLTDREVMGKSLNCARSAYTGGNFFAGWVAYATAYKDILGVKLDTPGLDEWVHLCYHSSARYVFKDFVVVSDFPTDIRMTADRKSHSLVGPALSWKDGTGVFYASETPLVPAHIMRPDLLTGEELDKLPEPIANHIRAKLLSDADLVRTFMSSTAKGFTSK